MKRVLSTVLIVPTAAAFLIVGALLAPATASANSKPVAECWGASDGWYATYKIKPRNCVFNGDEAHYAQTPLAWIHWRSWTARQACGSGTFYYNQGYRSRITFCIYRPRDGVFMRIRGRTGSHASYLNDYGKRVYITQKPHRFYGDA
jgi:hypothetical protein